MIDLTDKTLSEIVSVHNSAALVFEKHNIDFCCDGDLLLKDALKGSGIDLDNILHELDIAFSEESNNVDFSQLSITEVNDILRKEYHEFLKNKISEISALSTKVNSRFEDQKLSMIHDQIMSLFNHLAPHMISEEKVLFPYLEYMEHSVLKGKVPKPASFGKVKKSVSTMLKDHTTSAAQLDEIRELTNSLEIIHEDPLLDEYFNELKNLDINLRMHIFIENFVLFRKARAMEETLLSK